MDEKLKIVNIFGGPGCGKSTTAAGLYRIMKLERINVEYVTEYAKDLSWQKRYEVLERDQLYVTAKQNRRLDILRDQVKWVVSDSPILTGFQYMTPEIFGGDTQVFEKLVLQLWETYDNYNFFLDRKKPYNAVGRSQSEREAKVIDKNLHDMLLRYKIPYTQIDGDENASENIWKELRRYRSSSLFWPEQDHMIFLGFSLPKDGCGDKWCDTHCDECKKAWEDYKILRDDLSDGC